VRLHIHIEAFIPVVLVNVLIQVEPRVSGPSIFDIQN
jgi:hypothetical protein